MKNTHATARTVALFALILVLVLCLATALSLTLQASAYTSDPEATVSEIYNDSTGTFNQANLQTLLKKLINDNSSYVTVNQVSNQLSVAKDSATAISEKNIIVKFGGIKWIAVALTLADTSNGESANGSKAKEGDVILTLWQASGTELKEWNPEPNTATNEYTSYPTNMYSTSEMRTTWLNNGGWYSADGANVTQVNQDRSNTYAKFNMKNYNDVGTNISEFLVAPRYLAWQKSQATPITWIGGGWVYTDPNSCWGALPTDSTTYYNVYNPGHDYTGKAHYTDWMDDIVWLPSLLETGYDQNSHVGLWNTTVEQRQSGVANAWLRSATFDDYSCVRGLTVDGIYSSYSFAWNEYFVRPAIHLNLTAAANYVSTDLGDATVINEIFADNATTGGEFNQANLQQLINALAGSNTTVAQLQSTVSASSTTVGATSNAKTYGSTMQIAEKNIVVQFGGTYWIAVFLSSAQTPTEGKGSTGNKPTDGDVILTLWQLTGTEYATWSAGYRDNADGLYPANMYGTSKIRAVTLNNGGSYATSLNGALTTATQSTINPYAKFNMSIYSGGKSNISQYLVAPRYVSYQGNLNVPSDWNWKQAGKSQNNEAWGALGADQYYDSRCYEGKTNYAQWKDDLIWLPACSEIGNSYKGRENSGIWNTSMSQISSAGIVWLRTAHPDNSYVSYTLTADGVIYNSEAATSRLVRPALHLNLTAAAESVEHNYEYRDDGQGSHYQQCTLCGQETEHQAHVVTAATHTADNKHQGICAVCKLTVTEDCKTSQQHDNSAHWQECSVCKNRSEVVVHDWDTLGWTSNGSTGHTSKCTTCSESMTAEHTLGSLLHDDQGYYHKCTANGCTYETDRQDLDERHEHDYNTQKSDENYHWMQCECGARNDVQKHDDSEWKTEGNNHYKECATCSTKYDNGEHIFTYKYKDDNNHEGTCVICQNTVAEGHSTGAVQKDTNGHWYECSVCNSQTGYVQHDWDELGWKFINNMTHTSTCEICGENVTAEHTVAQWTNGGSVHSGTCEDCAGPVNGNHELGEYQQDAQGHYKKCVAVGCEYETSHDPHTVESAKDLGEQHQGICAVCKMTVTEKHATGAVQHNASAHWYECSVCKTQSDYTEHNWDELGWTLEGASHKSTCATCSEYKTESHKIEWKADGNGRHYSECSVDGCGFKTAAESHQIEIAKATSDNRQHEGVCKVCKLTVAQDHVTGELQHNKSGHWHECSVCNAKLNEKTHDWDALGWINQDVSTHKSTCGVCSEFATGEHSVTTWSSGVGGHNGKCQQCKATVTAVHTLGEYKADEEGKHYQQCTANGCNYQSAHDAHTVTAATYLDEIKHEGICSVCKLTVEGSHVTAALQHDLTGHWYECSVCKNKTDYTSHDWNAIGWLQTSSEAHTSTCADCGENRTEEHYILSKRDDVLFWQECKYCDYKTDQIGHNVESWAKHDDGTHSGLCTDCGEEIVMEHEFGVNFSTDSAGHWHECLVCGAQVDYGAHVLSTATSNGNEVHTGLCIECNRQVTMAHVWSEEIYGDENGYWRECKVCREKITVSIPVDPTPTDPTPTDPKPTNPNPDETKQPILERINEWLENTPLPLGIACATLGAELLLIIILAIAARKPKKH